MSDDEEVKDISAEHETNEPVDLPDDIKEALNELLSQAEASQNPGHKDDGEERDDEGERTKSDVLIDKMPPRGFWEWLKERHPGAIRSKKVIEIAERIYQIPETTTSDLRALGYSIRNIQYTIERLRDVYAKYQPYWMRDSLEAIREKEVGMQNTATELETLSEPPAEPKPRPSKKSTKSQPRKEQKEEKITNAVYSMSKSTTTFKEIDKTIAALLCAQFENVAVKEKVLARLGELVIYTLLQLGAIDRDKIVRYSETLVDDPDALYFYIKEQLDAVIKITDPETLSQVWMENATLKRKVSALEATADMLSDALNYYAQVIRFLISLLDKKQLEKFAAWIYMFEYMRMKKKKIGGVANV